MVDTNVDVVIVGAGFAGLRTLYEMRSLGFRAVVLEASDDIGGVWHFNRYPGARCDVESYDYSYMFSKDLEQEWRWSERYATQPEVLRYIHYVADRFDLRRHVRLNSEMTGARFDEAQALWHVQSKRGERWTCRYLIMAVGQLSTTKAPSFPGQSEFAGEIYHSGTWPRDSVNLAGKRVGIIGTGSSGVQMTPIVAREARHLTVFQRTANFSIPASNETISAVEDIAVKSRYAERRLAALNSPSGLGFVPNKTSALEESPEKRDIVYEAAWKRLGFGFVLAYYDILLNEKANETAAEFIRRKIAEQVTDPATREKLTPRGFPFGTKRPSVDSGYFQTFNRKNVELVDVTANPIRRVTSTGIETAAGHHPLDIIVFATGFDAFTGSLLSPTIVGRSGQTLREKWSAGPITYLGLGTAGFPNLFIIAGPGSPSLLSNVVLSIEQHVEWLGAFLTHAEKLGMNSIEATPEAEQQWVEHVAERAKETLYLQARSYYSGDEVDGKPRVFMPYSGGVRGYRRILQDVAGKGYDGFDITRVSRAQTV
ncbi:MAG: NAD(P)/FAD-dependent oxidoreductase [Steroidobacteraceae bacterium]